MQPYIHHDGDFQTSNGVINGSSYSLLGIVAITAIGITGSVTQGIEKT
jgi:hypothetical protein